MQRERPPKLETAPASGASSTAARGVPRLPFVVWMRSLVVVLACLPVLLFLMAAAKRLHYPFGFDWIEEGMLQSVGRLRAGMPLYGAPTVHFAPYLYTPLFFYLSALASHIFGRGYELGRGYEFGQGYEALRAVSIASTLGCFAAVYALVFGETRRHWAALAAMGCFAGCYPLVGEWFDMGRVDMLYLLLVLCGLLATRWTHPAFAALVWVCAFQAKQGVLPVAVLALCCEWQRPRRLVLGLGVYAAALLGSIAWLTHRSGGWYRFYVFQEVGGLGWARHQIPRILPDDLLAPFGIALLLTLAAALLTPPRPRSRTTSFYALATAGMVLFSGYIRMHRGADVNALLPAYAWIAVLFGIALGRLSAPLESRLDEQPPGVAGKLLAVLLAAAAVQLGMHVYSPREFVPRPDQVEAREDFLRQMRAIPGDVLVLGHPEYGLAAGKSEYASGEATGAVIDAKDRAAGDKLLTAYARLMRGGGLSAVVLDHRAEPYLGARRDWLPRDFLQLYPLRVEAAGSREIQYGVNQPQWIYLPCRELAVAKAIGQPEGAVACGAL